jgi:hypothetical protein
MVSRLFGQLVAMRQRTLSGDCATAGAAIAVMANPAVAFFRNVRRCI